MNHDDPAERLSDHSPEEDPDPEDWLAMDEGERVLAVQEAHEFELPDGHPIPEGGWRLHASMHVVVENQLAANEPPVTRETLARFREAGVSRHDSIHGLASVVGEHLQRALRERKLFDQASFARDLRALDPRRW